MTASHSTFFEQRELLYDPISMTIRHLAFLT
jgi:hypothetical protein